MTSKSTSAATVPTVQFWKKTTKKISADMMLVRDGVSSLADGTEAIAEGVDVYEFGTYEAVGRKKIPALVRELEQINAALRDFGVALVAHAGTPLTTLEILERLPHLTELAMKDPEKFKEFSGMIIREQTNANLNQAFLTDASVRASISNSGTNEVRVRLESRRAEITWGLPEGLIELSSSLLGSVTDEGDGYMQLLFAATDKYISDIEEKKNQATS